MELSFKDLQKRDVINITDGRCLGVISDIKLSFPNGVLTGIIVPGRKVNWFLKIFDRSEMFIDVSKIIRIGGDVILVNVNCGDVCSPSIKGNKKESPCPNPCDNICSGNFESFDE